MYPYHLWDGGGNACKTIAADISMKFIVFLDVEINVIFPMPFKCTLSNGMGVGWKVRHVKIIEDQHSCRIVVFGIADMNFGLSDMNNNH